MITKQLFVDSITAIQEQIEHDEAYSFALSKLFNTEHQPHYDHSKILKALINLLRIHFPSPADDEQCEIQLYVFVTNFGKHVGGYEEPGDFYERLTK